MRTILLFCILCGFTLSISAQEVTDTLEANVGAKARVLFLAKNPADFAELSNYDLNTLFSELYRREFGTDKKTMRLFDNEDAGLLSKRPGKKGLLLRVGVFAGSPLTRSFEQSVYENLTIPEIGEEPVWTYSSKRGGVTGRGSLGISLGVVFTPLKRARKELNIFTSVGFEWSGYKTQRPSFHLAVPDLELINSQQITDPDGNVYTEYTYDTLGWSGRTIEPTALLSDFSHLYLEVLPTIQFLRKNGRKGFKFGAGTRFGPDISQKNSSLVATALGTQSFFETEGPINPLDLQFTWLAVIGYGKFHLQISYLPRSVFENQSYSIGNRLYRQGNWSHQGGLLNLGIRYGL